MIFFINSVKNFKINYCNFALLIFNKMKKVILVGALALFGAVNAQIAKGTAFISGTVGYQGQKNNNNDVTNDSFTVVPTVGYFVAPNVAVGLGVGYASASEKGKFNGVDYKDTTSAFVIEPLVRKYWNVSDNFLLFGQLSVPMAFGNDKAEVAGKEVGKDKFSSFGVVVRPGIDYVVAPNWTIEATIGEFGYRSAKYKDAKSVDNYNFGLDLGSVTFGVKYLFK
ncbi:outer membrane protein [Soonwooa purpurea]